jgi:hypothetical protein
MKGIAKIIHWSGFYVTGFMLLMTVLDQSQDEIILHLIVSFIPITVTWLIACVLGGKRNIIPFIKK